MTAQGRKIHKVTLTGDGRTRLRETVDGGRGSKERRRRARRSAGHVRHDRARHRQRSSVGRVNSAPRDSCGGRQVRVWARARVACHLFFGVPGLTVHRLMRPVV